MAQPGEGEVIAGKRLLERVLPPFGRFSGVALADALPMEALIFSNFLIFS
jgi:hypothetical protein